MIETKADLSMLNEKQREGVGSEAKRLLVLAGGGSGKRNHFDLQFKVYTKFDAHLFDI